MNIIYKQIFGYLQKKKHEPFRFIMSLRLSKAYSAFLSFPLVELLPNPRNHIKTSVDFLWQI